jgi:hypothetical protein
MRVFRMAGGIRPGHAAAVLAFAVLALYLVVISSQDSGISSRVAFVAASIGGAAVICAGAELLPGLADAVALAWAAATLWIWVVLGMFSIGIVVAPAGVFAVIALTRRRAAPLAIAAGIAAAVLIAAAGLAWTA